MKLIFNLSCPQEDQLHVPCHEIHSGNRRPERKGLLLAIAVFVVSMVLDTPIAFGQDPNTAPAERCSIVVVGRVVKINASDEPMVEASTRTAIISVQRMYAGSEIAGDQTGRTVTVILSLAGGVKAGEEALFYGNPRFLGKSLTIADESEVPWRAVGASAQAAVERGVQKRKDKPVLDRLTVATLVFRGTVEKVEPVAVEITGEKDTRGVPAPTEHDPDWNAATVRITTPLRGGEAGKAVTVVFPASQDITWFNVPKLKSGQDAVFLVHTRNKQEEPLYRASGLARFLEKQPTYLVTQPFDVLPPEDEARVRGLVAAAKEKKQ